MTLFIKILESMGTFQCYFCILVLIILEGIKHNINNNVTLL